MKLGVLGAGQLGRMLALAGYPLGLSFLFLDPTRDSPASQLAPQLVAPYTDPKALRELGQCDVVTFEFENVPDAAARSLFDQTLVLPPPAALQVAQDRLVEKRCFQELGIATPRFAPVDDAASLREAVAELGLPSVLKTRRFGYDGKGQYVLQTAADVSLALARAGQGPWILEEFVRYQRELSLVAVRGRDGSTKCYPLIENEHHGGILRRSTAPVDASPEVVQTASRSVERLLSRLDYVGVLAVEFFDVGDELVANEFAPRVHNSGHLTIEAAVTSQFENHLRAIVGLPLGSTELLCHATMLNLVGQLPSKDAILCFPGAHYHDYGKQERAGRKLGHITITGKHSRELTERVEAVLAEVRLALERKYPRSARDPHSHTGR